MWIALAINDMSDTHLVAIAETHDHICPFLAKLSVKIKYVKQELAK